MLRPVPQNTHLLGYMPDQDNEVLNNNKAELDGLLAAIDDASVALDQAQDTLAAKNQEAEVAVAEAVQKQDELSKLYADCTYQEQIKGQLEATVTGLEAQISDLSSQFLSKSASMDAELSQASTATKLELANLQSQIDAKTQELNDITDKHEEMVAKVTELTPTLQSLSAQKDELDQAIELKNRQIGSADELLLSLRKQLDSTKTNLNSAISQVQSETEELTSLNGAVSQKMAEIKDIETDLQEKKMSIANILVKEQLINQKRDDIVELYKNVGIDLKID